MTATPPNSSLQINSGLWDRLLAGFTATPGLFQEGGVLHALCRTHLPLLRAAAKLATPPTAAAAPAALAKTSDAEARAVEAHFASLKTEQDRDSYVRTMARGIVHPMATAKPAAVALKPAEPALSLDAQFALLATHTDKAEFLAKHRLQILKRG